MERKGTSKVDFLKSIEKEVQKKWEDEKIHEGEAGKLLPVYERQKYFATFPFPYMNGRLHLGHMFSLSKCEFSVRYQRLEGRNCLFPFGFHATGMPIKACADKLQREMDEFGFPPIFPDESENVDTEPSTSTSQPKDKSKSKKSKSQAKSGNSKYQWNIMRSLGLNDSEIIKFCDSAYWLEYFPPLAIQDLKAAGLHIDWRRSFITTDINPFFNSFVQWQFRHLKKLGKVKFGERYTIYSPRDGQPCMDHDRSTGEGVGPQEYVLLKLEVVKPFPPFLRMVDERKSVYLIAATLRPETIYGLTNCWVKPDLEYVCFDTKSDEMYICTRRAALNLSYQGFTQFQGVYDSSIKIKGKHLLGLKIRSPMSIYSYVYVLPMVSIKPDKGTGVVASVPSDSPDDFINLEELKQNVELRVQYGLKDEVVIPFSPVPIIGIPEIGNFCAVTACEKFKVQSPRDTKKLEWAKEFAYFKGFYEGTMIIGNHCGEKTENARKIIKDELLRRRLAELYYEPEKEVISRSGEPCVVALCNQWYLDYGEKSWKEATRTCLYGLRMFSSEVMKNFDSCLEWLHEHACSRRYGLGTKLPWDEDWLIESLSDSTIYMAYYTIAHFLQGNSLTGENPNAYGIRPADLTDEIWDFIFLKGPFPENSSIPLDVASAMKTEFLYWYPVDLRTSGKDLIQNHLTFFLYVHTAFWGNDSSLWPRGIRANGHLMLNSAKMSKSEGNFLTLEDALEKYGADGMRLALADAGDSIEDANFVSSVADSGILRLYTFIEWTKEILDSIHVLRSGPPSSYTFHDKVFLSEMNIKLIETEDMYERTSFKEGLRIGFFEMQALRDRYREITGSEGMHKELILKFIKVQAIILSPICPHVAEYVYSTLLKENDSVVRAHWPVDADVDMEVVNQSRYLMDAVHSFRAHLKSFMSNMKKVGSNFEKPYVGHIWIAKFYPEWQRVILEHLNAVHKVTHCLPDNRVIAANISKIPALAKYTKRAMPFAQMMKEKAQKYGLGAISLTSTLDEADILKRELNYIKQTLGLDQLHVHFTHEVGTPEKIQQETSPGSPYISFEYPINVNLKIINPQPLSGYITRNISIRGDTTLAEICRLLKLGDDVDVKFLRWVNPFEGPRRVPTSDLRSGKAFIDFESVIKIHEDKKSLILQDTEGNVFPLGHSIIYLVDFNE